MAKELWYGVVAICVLCGNMQASETPVTKVYAQKLLSGAGRNDVEFREAPDMGHDEAFRVTKKGDQFVLDHQTSAGALRRRSCRTITCLATSRRRIWISAARPCA